MAEFESTKLHIIYGGAFDPPHSGHVESARHILKSYPDAHLVIMPGVRPAVVSGRHKIPVASFESRIEMCRLAFLSLAPSRVSISELESKLEQPVYTYKTLLHLKQKYPDTKLALLIGQDQLQNFPNWFRPNEILELASLLVVRRRVFAGSSDTKLAADAEKAGVILQLELLWSKQKQSAQIVGLGSKLDLIDIELPTAESHLIRDAIALGESIDASWLPDEIKAYISSEKLYRQPPEI
jgi:nicotinate (nicotinamide) nucleotide adenylyltransferase